MPSLCENISTCGVLWIISPFVLQSQTAFVAFEISVQISIPVLESGCLIGCLNFIALKTSHV